MSIIAPYKFLTQQTSDTMESNQQAPEEARLHFPQSLSNQDLHLSFQTMNSEPHEFFQ